MIGPKHLAVIIALFAISAPMASAQDVTLVSFTAEWCPNCKILDPRIEQAMQQVDREQVDHVVLDFTDDARREAAYETINGTLLANPYADYVGVTGLGVLMATDSGETIDCVNATMTSSVIVDRIQAAWRRVETTPIGKRSAQSLFCPPSNRTLRLED